MAEATSKTILEIGPPGGGSGKRLMYIKGTTGAGNDVFTVTPLTTVEGAVMTATDGTLGTFTFATNVITITSVAKTYSGIAWGTP